MHAGVVRLVGAGTLSAGLFSAWVVATDGQGRAGAAWLVGGPTIYGPLQALLALTLTMGGLTVVATRERLPQGAALGVAGLCAAVLAGTGVVGSRRWPLYWGCCADESITRPELVRSLALSMGVVCGLAAVACLAVLVRDFAGRLRLGLESATALLAGLVVATAGPLLVVDGWLVDTRGLIAWSLMYSVPFGTALALSGLMPRATALVLAGAVLVCAAAAPAGSSFLELRQPWGAARTLVLVAGVLVVLSRLLPVRDGRGQRVKSPA